MKRRILWVLAFAFAFTASATVTSAQTAPEFRLGFKALADQIPDVVGVPTENEYFNLSNGNSEQHTTKGLMVWRKADNWTAYTNGYTTWINGPNGVEFRLNTERFAWENDPARPGSPPAVAPAPAPDVGAGAGATPRSDGYVNVDGVWVPSPGNDPTGASAQCRDGTYSYSQHRQGTCSGHGGVARWLP